MDRVVRTNVIDFLRNELSLPQSKLTLELSLFHDLGVTGDDAAELLENFSCDFGVDLNEFEFQVYFGNESSVPLSEMILEIICKKSSEKFKRLEIQDLVKAAETGKLQ